MPKKKKFPYPYLSSPYLGEIMKEINNKKYYNPDGTPKMVTVFKPQSIGPSCGVILDILNATN